MELSLPRIGAGLSIRGIPEIGVREMACGQYRCDLKDGHYLMERICIQDAVEDYFTQDLPALFDSHSGAAKSVRIRLSGSEVRVRGTKQAIWEVNSFAGCSYPQLRNNDQGVLEVVPATAPILAVFDVVDYGDKLTTDMIAQFSGYVATRVTSLGIYQVVPQSSIRDALAREKAESYAPCRDDACQIELGKAVSAEKGLATNILRMGSACTVTANLYDIKKEVTDKGIAILSDGCSDRALMNAIDMAIAQLGGKASRPGPQPPTGPSPPVAAPGYAYYEDFSKIADAQIPAGWIGADHLQVEQTGRSRVLVFAKGYGGKDTIKVPGVAFPDDYTVDVVMSLIQDSNNCCTRFGLTVGNTRISGLARYGSVEIADNGVEICRFQEGSVGTLTISKQGNVFEVLVNGGRCKVWRASGTPVRPNEVVLTLEGGRHYEQEQSGAGTTIIRRISVR
ncbi:MAG: hypothetical protein HY791_31625 [Deltaproteobacteria bacterium]|nr:hypothetical protein [Deltaproteobacteria bacterium]